MLGFQRDHHGCLARGRGSAATGRGGGSAGIHLQPALQVQGPQPETPVVECALESRPFWRWKGNYLFTQLGVGEHLVISHTTILTVNI